MTDSIRCPGCRGAKKVPKLGGMIGECNTCSGKGLINACDKPVPVVAHSLPMTSALIKATADCVPASMVTITSDVQLPDSERVKVDSIKIDGKKAIYKRKRA